MGENVVLVGHDLKSCTAQSEPVFWPIAEPAHLQGRRLVLVDTPGFDDTYTSDSEILRRIAVTLASSCVNGIFLMFVRSNNVDTKRYDSEMKLGGIICLHDISRLRMLASDCQDLELFRDLCGSKALSSVVIGITRESGEISQEISEKRQKEFSSGYWKEMIDAGATVRELENIIASARDIINNLFENWLLKRKMMSKHEINTARLSKT